MAGKKVFISISSMLLIFRGVTIACPDKTIACPDVCMCSNTSRGYLADCTSQRLDQVPAGLSENITILDFTRNVLGRETVLAKHQLIQLKNLTLLCELRLQFNDIQLINSDAFPNLTAIRHLILANNFTMSVPSQALRSFPNLRYLDLSNNLITSLNRRILRNPYLTDVILRDNLILNINMDAFEGLSNLASLSLQGNDVTNVTNAFRHLSKLERIDLSQNFLQRVNEDIFAQNILLEKISLDSNDIFVLSSRTFLKQPDLKTLSLAFNNLNSSVLHVLNFLPNLTGLFMHFNKIEELPGNAFISNPNLVDLDLSSNNINVIHPKTFNGLTNLKTLQLSGNRLQILPNGAFDFFPNSTFLCLVNNPWVCNCSIVYLQKSLQTFQASCNLPQCSDVGSLTSVAAWQPSTKCDIPTTVTMTTAEVTIHHINITTTAGSSFFSQNIVIIFAIIPAVIATLILIFIVVCCCCCNMEGEPNRSTTGKDTSYNYWKNVTFPTRWSQTSSRLQEEGDKDTDKRMSLYERIKSIVQRPFSTVSLRKSDDYSLRTAGLSMETYLEASSNVPKKTNSYHNTVIGMETVLESNSEIANETNVNSPNAERDGYPQKDTSTVTAHITGDEKHEDSEKRYGDCNPLERPDCNIITKADINVPISLETQDDFTYAEIKEGIQDLPLPPIPSDAANGISKDTYQPFHDENKTGADSAEEGADSVEEGQKGLTGDPQDEGTQHCDDCKTGQRSGVPHPPSIELDQTNLEFGEGYINRGVIEKHHISQHGKNSHQDQSLPREDINQNYADMC